MDITAEGDGGHIADGRSMLLSRHLLWRKHGFEYPATITSIATVKPVDTHKHIYMWLYIYIYVCVCGYAHTQRHNDAETKNKSYRCQDEGWQSTSIFSYPPPPPPHMQSVYIIIGQGDF